MPASSKKANPIFFTRNSRGQAMLFAELAFLVGPNSRARDHDDLGAKLLSAQSLANFFAFVECRDSQAIESGSPAS